MSNWKKNLRQVEPYTPGEQPKNQGRRIIKLNTNENPYGPTPRIKNCMLDYDQLRLYPDPSVSALVEELARYHEVSPEQVFVGVGSDDVLAMAFMTCFNSDKPILFPDITYSFYDVWAELFKIPYTCKALDENFEMKLQDYQGENGGVIFPNPNAPTGILVGLDYIRQVLQANPDVVVIVDEAYIDFGGESALPLLKEYENLLVVRTFSKSRSMAGMRIGYAIGNTELIAAMQAVKYSYNSYTMDMPSIIWGVETVKDEAYFQETVGKIIDTRTWFCEKMKKMGFSFPESKANFIFATHESVQAKDIFQAAKEAGIYVRYFNKPRIDNYLRISIGTREEMQALIDFLQEYLK